MQLFTAFMSALTPHPFISSIWIVLTAFVSGLILNGLINSWLLYAVLIMFLSGMMVIFLYFSSLANNEKMTLTLKNKPLILCLMVFAYLNLKMYWSPLFSNSLMFFYSNPFFLTILILLVLLVIFLLVVVKISESFKGMLEVFWF